MFVLGKSDARRLYEKQHGGTKHEPLAKIWHPGSVKFQTRNCKLQFAVFQEKPDAKGLYNNN